MSSNIEKMKGARIVITGEGRVSHTFADYVRGQNQATIKMLTHQDCLNGDIPPADYFIHAGAKVFADESKLNPGPYVTSNILDTFSLLEHVRKNPPKLFVYLSTHEAEKPASPYAATKAAGEAMTRAWGTTYGFNWVVVRLPNLFIPRWDDKGFVGKLLRCEIKEPTNPSRYRQWLSGEEFAEWLWNGIQSWNNQLIELEGWIQTDQQIADRVEGYRMGAK